MWRNKSFNGTIAYTPFMSNTAEEEFRIPESSFLDPIKLSPDVVKEVIPEIETKASEQVTEISPATALISDLIWARETTSKNPTLNRVVEENWPVKKETVSSETINLDEIKRRQLFAESAGNAKAVSKAGAKGLYQIMDAANQDYIKATGHRGDLFDSEYNTKNRDWYWNNLGKHRIITEGAPSEQVRIAKQLAAYNWGIGNLERYIKKQKKAGVDVYQSLDWMEGLPKETRDYIGFILLNNNPEREKAYQRFIS